MYNKNKYYWRKVEPRVNNSLNNDDLMYNILLHSSFNNINNLIINKNTKKIINNDQFWKDKLINDFPFTTVVNYDDIKLSYKEKYYILYNYFEDVYQRINDEIINIDENDEYFIFKIINNMIIDITLQQNKKYNLRHAVNYYTYKILNEFNILDGEIFELISIILTDVSKDILYNHIF